MNWRFTVVAFRIMWRPLYLQHLSISWCVPTLGVLDILKNLDFHLKTFRATFMLISIVWYPLYFKYLFFSLTKCVPILGEWKHRKKYWNNLNFHQKAGSVIFVSLNVIWCPLYFGFHLFPQKICSYTMQGPFYYEKGKKVRGSINFHWIACSSIFAPFGIKWCLLYFR